MGPPEPNACLKTPKANIQSPLYTRNPRWPRAGPPMLSLDAKILTTRFGLPAPVPEGFPVFLLRFDLHSHSTYSASVSIYTLYDALRTEPIQMRAEEVLRMTVRMVGAWTKDLKVLVRLRPGSHRTKVNT